MSKVYPYIQPVYGQEEKDSVLRVFENVYFSGGKETVNFEKELATWWGSKFALSINSGSNSNFVALQALELPKGSEVITCASGAFPTTVNPIIILGYKPIFVDMTPDLKIDLDQVEKAITPKTKAIMFANFLGIMPDMDRLMAIIKKHNLKFVEDSCFPAGTKIKTNNGDKNIENIKVGDLVLTRKGYKKVLKSWKTGTKKVINNFGIIATTDHPIITKNGVKRLDKLIASDIIYIWNEKQSSIMEKNIIDTQTQNYDNEKYIFTDTARSSHFHFIDKFGLIILEKYLKAKLFTTKTIIHLITILKTSNVLRTENIVKNILLKREKLLREKILKLHNKKPQNGIEMKKGLNFIKEFQNFLIKIEIKWKKDVQFVVNCILHTIQKNQYIVPDYVKAEDITKKEKVSVYNLTVEGCHEFFANNVLVHNCDAMGSTFKGKKSGLWGDIATCSFYPAHTMTTGGEGGAIITNNFALYRKALSYRDWGRDCHCQWGSEQPACKNQFANPPFNHRYLYSRIGLNHKITEFQAAFGREQLKRVDGFIELRKRNYNILANILHTPTVSEVSPFAYPCFFENKEEAMIKLNEKGINTRVMFTGNLTKHPAYTKYKQDFPVADHLLKDGFFVGVGPHLSEEDMVFIGTTLSCL